MPLTMDGNTQEEHDAGSEEDKLFHQLKDVGREWCQGSIAVNVLYQKKFSYFGSKKNLESNQTWKEIRTDSENTSSRLGIDEIFLSSKVIDFCIKDEQKLTNYNKN